MTKTLKIIRQNSDRKALLLQDASRAFNHAVGFGPMESPDFTEALEKTLGGLSIGSLDHFRYLMECVSVAKTTGKKLS